MNQYDSKLYLQSWSFIGSRVPLHCHNPQVIRNPINKSNKNIQSFLYLKPFNCVQKMATV